MNILVYGDSNAWGYENGYQMKEDYIWVNILKKKMNANIYNESLPGRIAGEDEPLDLEINGKTSFKRILNSYNNLDAVIIALGTNDLQIYFEKSSDIIIDDLLWYNKTIKEKDRNIKVYYLLPSNFDYIDYVFNDESNDKRLDIYKYFKEHPEFNSIIPKDVILTDGVHFNYDSHKYIASLVYNSIDNNK